MTKIVYQQEVSEAPQTAFELGLSTAERAQLPDLQCGDGLWRVGQRAFVVRHVATDEELELFDTNSRMESPPARERPYAPTALRSRIEPEWQVLTLSARSTSAMGPAALMEHGGRLPVAAITRYVRGM